MENGPATAESERHLAWQRRQRRRRWHRPDLDYVSRLQITCTHLTVVNQSQYYFSDAGPMTVFAAKTRHTASYWSTHLELASDTSCYWTKGTGSGMIPRSTTVSVTEGPISLIAVTRIWSWSPIYNQYSRWSKTPRDGHGNRVRGGRASGIRGMISPPAIHGCTWLLGTRLTPPFRSYNFTLRGQLT